MRKFLSIIILIPLFFNCSRIKEFTSVKSKEKNSVTQTGSVMPGENTYGVITGSLKWIDKSYTPFSNVHRKDKELYDLLISNGASKKNLKLITDEDLTLTGMKAAVTDALENAPEGSTFIFYYAGHGVKEDDNSIYFANYDIGGGSLNKTGFDISWLGDAIRTKFKGSLVWLLADCCYSGALLDEAEKINAAGTEVIAVTSSASSNISTENWTFTQTLIDCFSGLNLADRNSDGKISVNELGIEVEDAMKYRERQMSGFQLFGVADTSTVSKTAGSNVTFSNTEFGNGTYCMGQRGSNYAAVRILKANGNSFDCEFYDYSDKSKVTLSRDELKPIYFVSFDKGDKVKVSWEGKWWDAEILKSQNDFYFIKYAGYDDFWNEWVAYDRIKTGREKTAQVEENGTWYPAEILEEKNGKYFIRYTNYDYNWDEWVGKERIKY